MTFSAKGRILLLLGLLTHIGRAHVISSSLSLSEDDDGTTETSAPEATSSLGSSQTDQSPSSTSTSFTQEPTASATSDAGPINTLLPALHWEYPADDPQNLVPGKESEFYFSHNGVSDPYTAHQFAQMTTTMQQDTVVLLHSNLISSITCSDDNGQISITFSDAASFSHAAASWESNPEFAVATYADSCGSSNDQHAFWLVREVSSDSATNSITCIVERELDLTDVFADVDLTWGTYHPPSNISSSEGTPPGSNGNGAGDGDFDARLDNTIGYFDFDDSDHDQRVSEFIPGIDFGVSKRSGLARRDSWNPYPSIITAIQSISNAVYNNVGSISNVITSPSKVTKFVVDLSLSGVHLAKTFYINLGPSKDTDSPWGRQKLIFQHKQGTQVDLQVYCVYCGIQGYVTFDGNAKWSWFQLKTLNIGVNANLQAGLNLGLVASVALKTSKKINLATYAVPGLGFSIPGIISGGTTVMVDAVASFDISASGNALVGIDVAWPNFAATLNAFPKDSAGKSGVTGYIPQFYDVAQASGKITASASLALPISVGIGIKIPLVGFDEGLYLVDKPSLNGKVSYLGSTCGDGFGYNIGFTNDVYVDIFGNNYPIAPEYSATLLNGCARKRRRSAPNELSFQERHEPRAVSRASVTAVPITDGGSSPTSAPSSPSTNGPSTTNGPSSVSTQQPSSSAPTVSAGAEDPNFNPADTGTSNYTGDVGDVTVDPNNTEVQYALNMAYSVASQTYDVGGVQFNSIIVGADRTYQVLISDDGNLYPTNSSIGSANGTALFGTYNGVAAINNQGLILHYYSDTMAQYNASRIRATDISETAATSRFVGLKSMSVNGSSQMLFAVDTLNNAYYLTLCNYLNNQTSKIFIAANNQGVSNLQKPELQSNVTGGPVDTCVPVALLFSNATTS